MDIGIILLRTVFIYFFILILLRVMGKREMGKLTVMDLVVSIMIAELAVIVIENAKTPLVNGLIPMLTLMFIQLTIAVIALKSRKIRRYVDGSPAVIIERGKLNKDEMRKNRYNMDDLMRQLREKHIFDVADVEFAILETTGQLSVFAKKDVKRPEESSSPARAETIYPPLPLIIDGRVVNLNLKKLNKTVFWLKNKLQQQGVQHFKEISFCSIDREGRIFLLKKEK